MGAPRQPLPNDRRTRQLYIDAAIKRAQARAREARLLAAEQDEQPTDSALSAAVPAQRESREPTTTG
jgi:hypothetical protein